MMEILHIVLSFIFVFLLAGNLIELSICHYEEIKSQKRLKEFEKRLEKLISKEIDFDMHEIRKE